MSFNPSIPQPSDFLSTSQSQLLSNNAALDASFDIDHTLFSDSTANNGMHKQVTLYQVETDPTLAFPATMIYTKNNGVTPNRTTDLYYATVPETGSASYIQMTNLTPSASANAGTGGGTIYTLITPWNIIFMWGKTTVPSSTPSVVFPVALSNSSYSVQLTIVGNTQPIQEVAKNNAGFSAKTTSTATDMEWLVIGVR